MARFEPLFPCRLFTYGTLMLPEVMRAVCGASFTAEIAVLTGYRRYRLRNEVFPAIIEEENASIHGLQYRGIDRTTLERLDVFEGDLYWRKEVQISLTDDRRVCCLAYVCKDQHRHLLDDAPWDVDLFRDRYLADFLAGLAAKSRAPDN